MRCFPSVQTRFHHIKVTKARAHCSCCFYFTSFHFITGCTSRKRVQLGFLASSFNWNQVTLSNVWCCIRASKPACGCWHVSCMTWSQTCMSQSCWCECCIVQDQSFHLLAGRNITLNKLCRPNKFQTLTSATHGIDVVHVRILLEMSVKNLFHPVNMTSSLQHENSETTLGIYFVYEASTHIPSEPILLLKKALPWPLCCIDTVISPSSLLPAQRVSRSR